MSWRSLLVLEEADLGEEPVDARPPLGQAALEVGVLFLEVSEPREDPSCLCVVAREASHPLADLGALRLGAATARAHPLEPIESLPHGVLERGDRLAFRLSAVTPGVRHLAPPRAASG